MAAISPETVLAASTVVGTTRSSSQRKAKLSYINGLSSFGGLKATNRVANVDLRRRCVYATRRGNAPVWRKLENHIRLPPWMK
ncbi:hypothetical protein CASFOL_039275 [Castilleja foliolosa]|uniref:Uncharacterized protein n=1 Tax=Castilleja foliolosa TaxID=1961234 RepID=A0ABD3BHI7_9LAMI